MFFFFGQTEYLQQETELFLEVCFTVNVCFIFYTDFMFNEDQDDMPFSYDDSVPLGDAPRDWTLPSVSPQVLLSLGQIRACL